MMLLFTSVLITACATSQQLQNRHLSIPLSQVATESSMRIFWDQDKQKAVLERGECHINIQPGSDTAWIGGETQRMEFPAYLHAEEIYIPQSFYHRVIKPLFAQPQEALAETNSIALKPVANSELARSNSSNLRVVIDAGHGGRDPGAISPQGQQEKQFTLAIAKKVAKYLRKIGVQVVMARTRDVFVALDNRVQIANNAAADCFVSIHLNSFGDPSASGFEIWISNDEQQPRYRKSKLLARWIRHYLKAGVPLNDRGIKKSNFRVVYQTQIPAVLVECAFISNKSDLQWVKATANQELLAQQIYRGILAYHLYLLQP